MDGIIVLNKEKGFSSFDCVRKIRKILNVKKAGHTGTLDPSATGVLVICLGEACKAVPYLESDTKEYLASIIIGISSDSYDLDGKIKEDVNVPNLSEELIDETLKSFMGIQKQVPPMYSAIKVNGQKLYNLARNGETIDLEPREIEIFNIERTSKINYENNHLSFDFKVLVSKGTYIRSLCVDIAGKLGYPGLMSSLIRTKSGVFSLNDSVSLNDLEQGNYVLHKFDNCLDFMPIIDDEDSAYKAYHGMKISPKLVRNTLNNNPTRIVIKGNGKLIAVYEMDESHLFYKAVRVWN